LSHLHAAALSPRQKVCRRTACVVSRYDHYCPFVANAVGLHNQVAFLAYCTILSAACVVYAIACAQERRAGRSDSWLDAAFLDTLLGAFAVGQLALWQTRLALRNGTAAELRALSRPNWDRVLYYFRTPAGGRCNVFDCGAAANWAAFWHGVPPPLIAPCDEASDAAVTADGLLTAPRLHALIDCCRE
jgi:hypothetical protein